MSNKGKKGNPFLNFIWLDKKRRAKNFSFLLTVLMIVSALGVGYINGLLGLITTGEEGKAPPVTQIAPQGQSQLDIDNNSFSEEDEDINEEEFEQIVSQNGREFLYNWAHNGITPMSRSDVINILLVGLDSRTGLQYGGRSDTLILLSLNKTTKKINMTSFFRDTYCNIDNNGNLSYNKINASYAKGGADCLINTLENNFKVNIDYYVTVDFATFEDIIDELGGLRVTVQKYEADYINRTTKLHVPYGENVVLDGEEALVFSRIRKCDSDSDVSRTRRQRMVITSLINSVKGASYLDLNNMLKTLLPYVKTNLSENEILTYAAQALAGGWLNYEIVETTLSDSTVFKTGYVGKSSVVFMEFPVAAQRLQKAIYGETNVVINEGDQTMFSLIKSL